MFDYLGFSEEEAKEHLILNGCIPIRCTTAWRYRWLDRLVSILGGHETIRDYIAFHKNNSGRDVMIDAPAALEETQLNELNLKLNLNS